MVWGRGAVSYSLLYYSKNYTQSLKCGISLLHDIRLTLTPIFPCLSVFVGFAGSLDFGHEWLFISIIRSGKLEYDKIGNKQGKLLGLLCLPRGVGLGENGSETTAWPKDILYSTLKIYINKNIYL